MNNPTPATSRADELAVSIPTAWDALTDVQLRYVCALMAEAFDPDEIKVLLILRQVPPRRLDEVSPEAVAEALPLLDWLDELPAGPIRPATLYGREAVHPLLAGVTFRDYLSAENYYQGYLMSHEPEALQALAGVLYPGTTRTLTPTAHHLLLLWMAGLKQAYTGLFPDLFSRAPASDEVPDLREIMNAEIRALTGGDITKLEAVLSADTLDALTELNAKAREAREIEKLNKH